MSTIKAKAKMLKIILVIFYMKNHLILHFIRRRKNYIHTFVIYSGSSHWDVTYLPLEMTYLLRVWETICKGIMSELKVFHSLNLFHETLLLLHADGLMVPRQSLTQSHFQNTVPRFIFCDYSLGLSVSVMACFLA